MLLLFLTVIYSCIVYVGQKPTRACVVLLFKYADYKKNNLSNLILSDVDNFKSKVLPYVQLVVCIFIIKRRYQI